jgi:hypothetical protein
MVCLVWAYTEADRVEEVEHADQLGRYIPHTESKSALVKPDSLIRGSLKERWTQVSEEDLSQESRQAIKTKVDDLAAKKA